MDLILLHASYLFPLPSPSLKPPQPLMWATQSKFLVQDQETLPVIFEIIEYFFIARLKNQEVTFITSVP